MLNMADRPLFWNCFLRPFKMKGCDLLPCLMTSVQGSQGPSWQISLQKCLPQFSCFSHTLEHLKISTLLHFIDWLKSQTRNYTNCKQFLIFCMFNISRKLIFQKVSVDLSCTFNNVTIYHYMYSICLTVGKLDVLD